MSQQNSWKHSFIQKHLISIYCVPGLVQRTTHYDRKQVTALPRKRKASNSLLSLFWVKHPRKRPLPSETLTREETHAICFKRYSFQCGLIRKQIWALVRPSLLNHEMGSCRGSSVLWIMTVTHTYPNVKEGGGGQMKSKQTSLDTYLSSKEKFSSAY